MENKDVEKSKVEKDKRGGVLPFINEINIVVTIVIACMATLFPTFKNVDLMSQVRLWDFDGLFLYQASFALLAALCALCIVYVMSLLANTDKACSFVKRWFFYIVTFSMIYLFSVSLREFYAPTSSFTSYFLEKELKVNYGLVQVESGIQYEILACSKSGRLIKCSLDVSNTTEDDMSLSNFDDISLFDQSNHRGFLEKVIFDDKLVYNMNQSWKSHTIHLTKKSTASLSVFFSMSDKSASKLVKKLEFNFYYFGDNRLVTFRNLELPSSS